MQRLCYTVNGQRFAVSFSLHALANFGFEQLRSSCNLLIFDCKVPPFVPEIVIFAARHKCQHLVPQHSNAQSTQRTGYFAAVPWLRSAQFCAWR